MKPKLILIEGLPGSGKSTTARLVHEILTDKGMDAELYMEGNLDHPADYEGVAFFTETEFEELLAECGDLRGIFQEKAMLKSGRLLVPYMKLKEELGHAFPDDLLVRISRNDIYELPFQQNVEIITDSWKEFAKKAAAEEQVYVFECCFIQNPVTIGMVKYGALEQASIDYVQKLAKAVEPLHPLMIYVKQKDIETSFRKAVAERPEDWFKGFVHYYTSQGYGAENSLNGLEGTIEVLKVRAQLENKILDHLPIPISVLDNSQFDLEVHRKLIEEVLQGLFINSQ
ncbi:hypothetical protein [Mesobacillus subterraneus]|uniref:Adenylyl-sulfate kinase n=1 Tax=Mesobacillus subterraneus TaxID=285983 RepID=A0A427TRC7_9BACI|nr:hypothetical protein [Mesobacillus subterraneus]RSD26836.1 hypothetical protein EJA10_13360 [Mesobacillus subterraneus]